MKKYKIMKKIFIPTISTLIPNGLLSLLKPALLMLVLVVMGSNLSFGQVSVQVLNSTNVPTLVQNNTIGYNVPVGGNRMLLVMISNTERTVSTITFNGDAMTLVTANTTDNRARTHIYRLLNPVQGFGTLVVNFSGAEDRGANIGIVTLGNVDQADPTPYSANTFTTSTSISHSVTSVSGQLVLDVVASNKDALTSAVFPQVEMWKTSNGSEPTGHGGSYKTATGASTTMSWTKPANSNKWSMSLVSVKPACITASVSLTQPTCISGNNGVITVTSPTGGSGSYEYQLNSGAWQSSNTFTGLAPGTYSVQIRDANNISCTVNLGSYILATNPVVFEAVTSTAAITGTVGTVSHTTGTNANRLMLVGVSTRQRTIAVPAQGEETLNVTYGGDPLIFVGGQTSQEGKTYIFMMVDPPSGTANVSVTFSGGDLGTGNAGVIGVTTYSNVNINSPIGSYFSSFGTSISPSLTISSTATNQRILTVLGTKNNGRTVTLNSGQTQRWFSNTYQPTAGGYGLSGLAGSTVASLTLSSSDDWSLSGVAINPIPVADLTINLGVNETGPFAGEEIEYTVTATNLGCDAAPNVVVNLLMPDGFVYVSHTAPAGTTYTVGAGLWIIENLASGASLEAKIRMVVQPSTSFTATATISGDVVDNNTANNSKSVALVICQAGGTAPLFRNN